MDSITTYIDHMFSALPHTSEVRRARGELLQMSEDRYLELRAEGLTENEAVGRVITQFGNLDELADELGIRTVIEGGHEEAIALSAADAEGYLRTSARASTLIGTGVLAILVGLAIQQFVDSQPLGLGLFLTFVAAGVASFAASGILMGQFSQLEDRVLHLDGATLAHYRSTRESELREYMGHIVGGLAAIILGAAFNAIGYSLEDGVGFRAAGPIIIGAGVFLLIRGGMRRMALDRLTSQGDFARTKQEDPSLVSRWAGPYWLAATTIYVAWSFITGDWGTTWIVWPIAGVAFALLAAVLNAARPQAGSRPR